MPVSASTRSIFTPVRVVPRRRHPSRLRRVHLLPQRGSARHRDAFPPQDAAAGHRRDEHRLLHVDPPGRDLPPCVRDACSTRRSSRSASSAWRSPQFFIGQVILLITSVRFSLVQFGDGPWTHLIFPAITLALPAIGRLTMVVRSAMIDELNSQYVKAARAKGVSRVRIVGVHALRNAGDPVRHAVRLGGDPRPGRVHARRGGRLRLARAREPGDPRHQSARLLPDPDDRLRRRRDGRVRQHRHRRHLQARSTHGCKCHERGHDALATTSTPPNSTKSRTRSPRKRRTKVGPTRSTPPRAACSPSCAPTSPACSRRRSSSSC